jgi:magnesium-transporting ATPase (P-type)
VLQAIIVTGALQSFADMALILGVVVINIAIGLIQEGKAENAAEAIKAMLSSNANVIRDGERKAIDADLVVPGDVVLIKSGDKIPADMRLITYSNLQVGECGICKVARVSCVSHVGHL